MHAAGDAGVVGWGNGVDAALAAFPAANLTGTVDDARLPVTIARKAWLPLNVRDFGAVGDGITDDTAALQACIDAACGGPAGAEPSPIRYATREVYLPSGKYRITAPLLIKSVVGFVMRGAGIRQSSIAVAGSIVNGITVIGSPTLLLEDFKVCSVGGWTGTDAITAAAIALDFTPAQSAAWGGSAAINRVIVEEVKFKYGFTLGLNSGTYDLAEIHLTDCIVNGQRVLDSADTTLFQAGYYSSNATGGNPVNHYYTHCIGSGLRRLYHIALINTVSIRGGNATGCDSVIHKSGICTFSYKDARVEENRRLFTSDANTYASPSIISMENITWTGSSEATDHIIFTMAENGLVTLKNLLLRQGATVFDWLFSFAGGSSKGSHLLVDGIVTTNATSESLISVTAGTKLFAEVRGMSQSNDSVGLTGTCVGRKVLVYNGGPTDATYLPLAAPSLALGNGVTAGDSLLLLNAPAGNSNMLQFERAGALSWYLYDAGTTTLYFRDAGNAKMHMTLTPGAGTGGSTEVNSALKVLGNLGFYGATPVTKPVITGSRGTESAATTSTRAALVALGLVTDSTTA